ncbi:MAG: hypothetical protein QOG30_529, partial [Acidimicrobiaceae bacterium]
AILQDRLVQIDLTESATRDDAAPQAPR